jgi:hypothetical protein
MDGHRETPWPSRLAELIERITDLRIDQQLPSDDWKPGKRRRVDSQAAPLALIPGVKYFDLQ